MQENVSWYWNRNIQKVKEVLKLFVTLTLSYIPNTSVQALGFISSYRHICFWHVKKKKGFFKKDWEKGQREQKALWCVGSDLSSLFHSLTWTGLLICCHGNGASRPQNNQKTFKAIISPAWVYWLLNILCYQRDTHLENFGWSLSKHLDNVKGLKGKKSSPADAIRTWALWTFVFLNSLNVSQWSPSTGGTKTNFCLLIGPARHAWNILFMSYGVHL